MAREPSYPKDAPVGAAAAEGNEPAREPRKSGESRRTKHIVAGAAIGIGSAAIVAALLYANRSRRS
jgi:hypothetical protein